MWFRKNKTGNMISQNSSVEFSYVGSAIPQKPESYELGGGKIAAS